MNNLIKFLLKASWVNVVVATIVGLMSGSCSAAAIALIGQSIGQITPEHPQAPPELMLGFSLLAATVFITNLISQFLLVRLTANAIYKLRLRISGWILASPLRHLEELGTNRLLATLTEDIQAIANGVFNIPTLCINAAIVLASLAYLAWLSVWVFLGTLVLSLLGIGLDKLLFNRALRILTIAREEHDKLMQHFQAITSGIKELKLHSQRREDFITADLQSKLLTAISLQVKKIIFY